MKDEKWLSVYVYYTNSCDEILKNLVLPLVQTIESRQYASQFFFIRYADRKGEHLRLRFKGDEHILDTTIRPLLLSTFQDYTLRFVRYIPELNRYGGKVGMKIAQEQFDASSKAVLNIISQNATWNYNRALGGALQLHIGMTAAFGMKQEEASDFFTHLVSPKNEAKFESNSKQNPKVLSQLATLWNACKKNHSFTESWFNEWLNDMRQTNKQLHQAKQNNDLQLPDKLTHDDPLWSLYESYIHMTNNRLGITSFDEEYSAYIIMRSFKHHE